MLDPSTWLLYSIMAFCFTLLFVTLCKDNFISVIKLELIKDRYSYNIVMRLIITVVIYILILLDINLLIYIIRFSI